MDYPAYSYPFHTLYTGSSLGNFLTFARLSAETDLEGLWSASDSEYYVGRWSMTFACDGRRIQPQETLFAPESQTTIFRDGDLTVEKQFFIPMSRDERSIPSPSPLRTAVYVVRIRNVGAEAVMIKAHHALTFPACPTPIFTKQPTRDQEMIFSDFGFDRRRVAFLSPESMRMPKYGLKSLPLFFFSTSKNSFKLSSTE